MSKITVLTIADRIACFYSLMPFFFCPCGARFTFTVSPEWCLRKDKNKVLILMRQFIKPDRVDLDLLKSLRAKYERVVFFHDDAGGGIPRLEALPYTDLFYCKALFRDRDLYRRSLYGKELYSDYYHRKYGVTDPDWKDRPGVHDAKELDKLRLSWNIGAGDYPRDKLRQRAGVAAAQVFGVPAAKAFYRRGKKTRVSPPEQSVRDIGAHCRIGRISRPSVDFQRGLVLEKVQDDPLFLTGSAPQAAYNRELARAKIVVSPFGWGELCLRDFETVRAGALLLKPDMSHLETWPDVFTDGETCAFFDWDAENLREQAHRYAGNESERIRIAENAARVYRSAMDGLAGRFQGIIREVLS